MGAIIRIGLRYGAGFLVARGLLGESDGNMLASDPEVAALIETGIGLALGAASEAWYWLAKKFGWSV